MNLAGTNRTGLRLLAFMVLVAGLWLGGRHQSPEAHKRMDAQKAVAQGHRERRTGRYREAIANYERAVADLSALNDWGEQGTTLLALAQAQRSAGNLKQARARLEQARALPLGQSHWLLAELLAIDLGNLALEQQDFAKARRCFQDALGSAREHRDRPREAGAWIGLGDLALLEHRPAEGQRAYEEALRIHEVLKEQCGVALVWSKLGFVPLQTRHYDRAASDFARSLALFKECGNQRGQALALENLAQVAMQRGQVAEAQARYIDALRIYKALNGHPGVVRTLTQLGGLAHDVMLDPLAALTAFDLALQLRPDDPSLRANRAEVLFVLNRMDEFQHEVRALADAPSSAIRTMVCALSWGAALLAGDSDEAVRWALRLRREYAQGPRGRSVGWSFAGTRQALRQQPGRARLVGLLELLELPAGDPAQLERFLTP